MKRLLLIFCALPVLCCAQTKTPIVDSLKRILAQTKDPVEKIELMGGLAEVTMSTDRAESDDWGRKMLQAAELLRDRHLIIKAYLSNGQRCSYMTNFKEYTDRALQYYNEALAIARRNKFDLETAGTYLAFSAFYRNLSQIEKALTNCNQAWTYISAMQNDSLKAEGYLELGLVHAMRREKVLSLRNYLAALRIAEEYKPDAKQTQLDLMRRTYGYLSSFYISIEDYDRAIDYGVKAIGFSASMKDPRYAFSRPTEWTKIGRYYGLKKNYDMAQYYFEEALRIADSLNFPPLKVAPYIALLNNYLMANQPQKALNYFNSNEPLRTYLNNYGYGQMIDQAYGYIYSDLGVYDSAFYYYAKAAPMFLNSGNNSSRLTYYTQMGRLNKRAGNVTGAINYYLQAKGVADTIGDLKGMQMVAQELDSLYRRNGQYDRAIAMMGLQTLYKDSLDKLGKEKDLMQIEASDEQDRQKRVAEQRAEERRKRHQIQYLAITIAIAASFVLLAMTGFFRVSKTTIKLVGFFSFLMFFEFIFLLFKKNIATITQGEPWKDLVFMILLAAILLPLHHWVEEKVIHYITGRQEQRRALRAGRTRVIMQEGIAERRT